METLYLILFVNFSPTIADCKCPDCQCGDKCDGNCCPCVCKGCAGADCKCGPNCKCPKKGIDCCVAGPCKCSKSLFFCLLSKSLWLFHVFISFVFIKQVVYRFISSLTGNCNCGPDCQCGDKCTGGESGCCLCVCKGCAGADCKCGPNCKCPKKGIDCCVAGPCKCGKLFSVWLVSFLPVYSSFNWNLLKLFSPIADCKCGPDCQCGDKCTGGESGCCLCVCKGCAGADCKCGPNCKCPKKGIDCCVPK